MTDCFNNTTGMTSRMLYFKCNCIFLKEQIEGKNETWRDVCQWLKMSYAQREMISEVIRLIKLILLIPATNASSEQAASAVCHIKTYLTMEELEKLNHCMILVNLPILCHCLSHQNLFDDGAT